jgi:hypothetical protein
VPREAEKRRGVRYYRTKKLKHGKYFHFAVVRKAGPRGGHTIAGRIRKRKMR